MNSKTVSKNMKRLMRNRELNKTQMSECLGFWDFAQMEDLLSGTFEVSNPLLKKIAACLSVSVTELLK